MIEQEREERNQRIMADYERAKRLEHKSSYNCYEFKWLWREEGIPCPGLWAYGGYDKSVAPVLQKVALAAPTFEPVPGFYCYLGPLPVFSDTYYLEEHGEGVKND